MFNIINQLTTNSNVWFFIFLFTKKKKKLLKCHHGKSTAQEFFFWGHISFIDCFQEGIKNLNMPFGNNVKRYSRNFILISRCGIESSNDGVKIIGHKPGLLNAHNREELRGNRLNIITFNALCESERGGAAAFSVILPNI